MDVMQELRTIVDQKMAPGVSAAWLHDGVAALTVYGEATWQPTKTPLHSGMLYDLASLTKVIGTTTVFLQALDDGRVGVDDAISGYLPEFHQPTTFRQALTHTSGLEGYIPHRDELPPKALRQALITQLKVTGECDHEVVYRDVNLLLVGWALENIYGRPIQALIQQRVLSPLGLQTATFAPDPSRCVPTTYSAAAGLRRGVVHDPKAAILREHSGAAGLFAGLDDLICFSEFAFARRHADAWPQSFATILRDETTNQLGRSLGWDLRRDAGGRLWLYHTGYTGTFWLIQPQLQESLIVLTNRVHPKPNMAFLAKRDELITNFMAAHS